MSQNGNNPIAGAVASIYLGAFVICLTQVSYAASSTVLREMFGFSNAQYGSIYMPQLLAAIAGALGGGGLVKSLGIKRLYALSLGLIAFAQAALAACALVTPNAAYLLILVSTASFGLGFGLCVGSLNACAVLLFPRRPNVTLTLLHMTAGLGLTVGPFLFGTLAKAGYWLAAPSALLAGTLSVLAVTLVAHLPSPPQAIERTGGARVVTHAYFWIMLIAAVLYAMAEGGFSNWAVIYVQEVKGLPVEAAVLALTFFWGAMTAGRLLLSLLMIAIPAAVVAFTLPLLMAAAFLVIPHIHSASSALGYFAFAGLSCSALFPLIIGVTTARFPTSLAWCASMLTAGMMFGGGAGSFIIGLARTDLSMDQIYVRAAMLPCVIFCLLAIAQCSARERRAPPNLNDAVTL